MNQDDIEQVFQLSKTYVTEVVLDVEHFKLMIESDLCKKYQAV